MVDSPARRDAPRRATYEDVLAAPEHLVAELIDGELILSPRPAAPHARTSSRIGGRLDPFDGDDGDGGNDGTGPGGWWILDEPELHVGADVVVPDLAGWRRARLPVLGDVPYFELAPDWVCEVISPSSGRRDRIAKAAIYAQAGVVDFWLVEPDQRTLEAYRLERGADGPGRWVRIAAHGGEETVRVEPFAALPLNLGRLWR